VCYANSEKVLKLDAKRREYDVVVIGEEPHLAYNRVGLTSFFQHRKAENLYLNPRDWVSAVTWAFKILLSIYSRNVR
jgi:nitrite reductase (NAD(P)H)